MLSITAQQLPPISCPYFIIGVKHLKIIKINVWLPCNTEMFLCVKNINYLQKIINSFLKQTIENNASQKSLICTYTNHIKLELETNLLFYCEHRIGCIIIQNCIKNYGDQLYTLSLLNNHDRLRDLNKNDAQFLAVNGLVEYDLIITFGTTLYSHSLFYWQIQLIRLKLMLDQVGIL